MRLAPGWPDARARLAQYLLGQGRAAEALEFVYGHQYESIELIVQVSGALFNLGRYEEAISTVNAAMEKMAEIPSWIFGNQWLAQSRNGDHASALRTARRALRTYPREAGWHLRIASSLRSMGRFAAANRETESARFEGLNWDGVLEGDYERAWDLGQYKQALEIVNKQIGREPKKEGEYLSEAQAPKLRVLLELGSIAEAEALVNAQKMDTVQAWRTPTLTCLEGRAWELAAEYAKRILALDPQDLVGRLAHAEVVVRTGHVEEGAQAFEAVRAADPRDHNAYEKLAVLRAVEGKLDDALELAERAVLLGEFCPFSWATRGYVYFLRGQWDLARSDLEAAWTRADITQKRHEHWFWWILANLQNKPIMAFSRRRSAQYEADTEWYRQQLHQIGDHLRRTAGARFKHSYFLKPRAWLKRSQQALSRAYDALRGRQSRRIPTSSESKAEAQAEGSAK